MINNSLIKRLIQLIILNTFVCILLPINIKQIRTSPLKPQQQPGHQINSCLLLDAINADSQDYNVSFLHGAWFDMARTNFRYKNSTWKNGQLFIKYNLDLNQVQIDYTAFDNSRNECKSVQELRANFMSRANANFVSNNKNLNSNISSTFMQNNSAQSENFVGKFLLFNLTDDVHEMNASLALIMILCYDYEVKTILSSSSTTNSFSNPFSATNQNSTLNYILEKCPLNKIDLFIMKKNRNTQTNVKIDQNESKFVVHKLLDKKLCLLEKKSRSVVINSFVYSDSNICLLPREQANLNDEAREEEIIGVDLNIINKEEEYKFKNGSYSNRTKTNDLNKKINDEINQDDELLFKGLKEIEFFDSTLITIDSNESNLKTTTMYLNDLDNQQSQSFEDQKKSEGKEDFLEKTDLIDEEDEMSGYLKDTESDKNDQAQILFYKEIENKNNEILSLKQAATESITTTTQLKTTITTTSAISCKNDLIKSSCPIKYCKYGRKRDPSNSMCELCDCMKLIDFIRFNNTNNDTIGQNEQRLSDECNQYLDRRSSSYYYLYYCREQCLYGSYTNELGCQTCACKPRPSLHYSLPSSCPQLECEKCNYGSLKDQYGCDTCICIRPNQEEASFDNYDNDYDAPVISNHHDEENKKQKNTENKLFNYYLNNCSTNKCATNTCKYGTYLDRNGCPLCNECLPNPRLKINCAQSIKWLNQSNKFTECDDAPNEHHFKPKQCNHEICKCVRRESGIPILDFHSPINESNNMNCECALALYDVSIYKAYGFKLYCASNGNYEPIQCLGSACACVNEHGEPLGPSVPIYQKHLLRCDVVFQRVYYDKQLTTKAPITLEPPLCLMHRQSALKMKHIDFHVSIPECEQESGLYLPVQCDRLKKYCWCVNVYSGVELYGTRVVASQTQTPQCP